MRTFVIGCVCSIAVAVAACTGSTTTATTTTATLSGVTMSVLTTLAGSTVTGTVTLSAAAPSGGIAVTLTSSSPTVTVPATITVAAGSTSQSFAAATSNAAVVATITATYSGVSQTTSLTVTLPSVTALQGVVLSSNVAAGGQALQGTITLTAPAPAGGLAVALASSSPLATVPSIVTVPVGLSTQTFEIDTASAASPIAVTITASSNGTSQKASFTIGGVAIGFGGVGSVLGGLPVTATINLPAPAPDGGATVALTSSSSDAQVPSSVIVPAGATFQTFTVTTVDVPPTTSVAITAVYGGSATTATLTVIAHPVVSSLACSPANPSGGTSAACTVTLASAAPAGGWQIALSTDNTVATVPSAETVPPGSTSFQFTVATSAVSAATTVTIQLADAPSGLVLWRELLSIAPSATAVDAACAPEYTLGGRPCILRVSMSS